MKSNAIIALAQNGSEDNLWAATKDGRLFQGIALDGRIDWVEYNLPPMSQKQRVEKKAAPKAMYQAVIDAYMEACPELPAVRFVTDKRKKLIDQVWYEKHDAPPENPDETKLQWFQRFFDHCRKSDFLMGRNKKENGKHANWTANMEWLLNHRYSIMEGQYHR